MNAFSHKPPEEHYSGTDVSTVIDIACSKSDEGNNYCRSAACCVCGKITTQSDKQAGLELPVL